MRIAIISDLHANLPALDAVLAHSVTHGATHTLCLGDVVGYHALPEQTIARLRERQVLCVRGNHDLAVTGALSDQHAGPLARRAIRWTRAALSAEDLAWLKHLPATLCQWRRLLCVHAALDDIERRLASDDDFRDMASVVRAIYPEVTICLTGHTHEQLALSVASDGTVTRHGASGASARPGALTFVNPGSVGRPLDGDRRAAYAVLDFPAGAVTFHRVEYDRTAVDAADAAANLLPPVEASWGERVRGVIRALRGPVTT